MDFNGTYYYYLRNGQGDIVKIIDSSGVAKVEYTYDSWGKKLSCTGTLATTLGALNPFRYRGYVYDEETQWYYLKSRYYDPETCRFISADVLLSTGQGVLGHNCYAYCGNNPIICVDSGGTFWETVVIGVILLVLSSVSGCAKNDSNDFGIETTNNGNCYQYATGLPYDNLKGLYYPGFSKGYAEGYQFKNQTELLLAIQTDYNTAFPNSRVLFIVSPSNSNDKPDNADEWIIAYCYHGSDFHFFRYDYEIGWTHKPGWDNKPTNLDFADKRIINLNEAYIGEYDPSSFIYLKIQKKEY